MRIKFEVRKRGAGCTVRLRDPDGLHVSVHVPKGASKSLLQKQARVVAMSIFTMLPNWKDRNNLRADFEVAFKRFHRKKTTQEIQ